MAPTLVARLRGVVFAIEALDDIVVDRTHVRDEAFSSARWRHRHVEAVFVVVEEPVVMLRRNDVGDAAVGVARGSQGEFVAPGP